MASAEHVAAAAELILSQDSERTAVVVSAMGTPGNGVPKVTDLMFGLVHKAESRDKCYEDDLATVREKHFAAAAELLGEGSPECDAFLQVLDSDISDLRAMLKAIYIAGNATETFCDFVVGHGELWLAQMFAAKARQTGANCAFLDAREVLVKEEDEEVNYDASNDKMDAWWRESSDDADVVIITGFIASTPDGIPTTLKRNGSDFSATIFGALLQASTVTIWTDVDGVYSADPRMVTDAVVLKSMSYQEAWEMSYFGANVLHPRTTQPAMQYNTPIKIRNFFNLDAAGTTICSDGVMEGPAVRTIGKQFVKGFATIDDVSMINVEGTGMVGVPGMASAIFTSVRDAGVNVIMISQASSEHSVCFAVKSADATAARDAVEQTMERMIHGGIVRGVEVLPRCAILAAVGGGMANERGVAATMFTALAKANINVTAIAQGASENNITVVVDGDDTTRALRAVHSRFYLSDTPLAVGIVGPGLVGKTLLAQLNDMSSKLEEEYSIDLRVLGIANSRQMITDDTGIDLNTWEETFENKSSEYSPEGFTSHILSPYIPNRVIIDCTASGVVAEQYEAWLKAGIHVITPNKKANSGELGYYQALRAIQRESYTHYFYEATVGAGLPILSTLKGLLETGDRVKQIEGVFSGTLSYIFNSFDSSQKFSDVVVEAKALGYTEPDPRDDLDGMDVARKVCILARECGMTFEDAGSIEKMSLVPDELQSVDSIDKFMTELPKYDDRIAKQAEEAAAAGKVLRFVGVVDVENGKGSVELRQYDKNHPFATLQGSDNMVSFRTVRYDTNPLIVRGPGAGAEVTAGGVFSDLLRLAAYLGAPS